MVIFRPEECGTSKLVCSCGKYHWWEVVRIYFFIHSMHVPFRCWFIVIDCQGFEITFSLLHTLWIGPYHRKLSLQKKNWFNFLRPFTDIYMHMHSNSAGLLCAVSLCENFKLCWPVNQVIDQGNVYSDNHFYILCSKGIHIGRLCIGSYLNPPGQGRGQNKPCRQYPHLSEMSVEYCPFSYNTSFWMLIQRNGVWDIIFGLSVF